MSPESVKAILGEPDGKYEGWSLDSSGLRRLHARYLIGYDRWVYRRAFLGSRRDREYQVAFDHGAVVETMRMNADAQ